MKKKFFLSICIFVCVLQAHTQSFIPHLLSSTELVVEEDDGMNMTPGALWAYRVYANCMVYTTEKVPPFQGEMDFILPFGDEDSVVMVQKLYFWPQNGGAIQLSSSCLVPAIRPQAPSQTSLVYVPINTFYEVNWVNQVHPGSIEFEQKPNSPPTATVEEIHYTNLNGILLTQQQAQQQLQSIGGIVIVTFLIEWEGMQFYSTQTFY